MSTFRSVSKLFRRASTKMNARITKNLLNECADIRKDFQERSPVDSGRYRANWRLKASSFRSPSTIASVSIYNDTRYSYFMDLGAEKNQAPWFFPSKARRTGKLAVRNGRVWAGGLNPGHGKTMHGAIGPALVNNNKRLNKMANSFADTIIKEFR